MVQPGVQLKGKAKLPTVIGLLTCSLLQTCSYLIANMQSCRNIFNTFCISLQIIVIVSGWHVYLTAKETHIFNIHLYQKPLSIFILNDMSMFDRTHSFVLNHLIRHYTFNNIFLLINAKNAKTAPYIGNAQDLNPISLHVTRTHCNR